MNKLEYLITNVFVDLKNLNDGFDSKEIYYFSESDFDVVLNRIEKLGVGIYGIEAWLNGAFYDVLGFEDYNTIATDPKWYRKAFFEFKQNGKPLLYAASYNVPEKLFNNKL